MKQILIILITVVASLNFVSNAKNNVQKKPTQEEMNKAAYILINKFATESSTIVSFSDLLNEKIEKYVYYIDLNKSPKYYRDLIYIDTVFSKICNKYSNINRCSAWNASTRDGIIGTLFIVNKVQVIVIFIHTKSDCILLFYGIPEKTI